MKIRLTAFAVIIAVVLLSVPCSADGDNIILYYGDTRWGVTDFISEKDTVFVPIEVYSAFDFITVSVVDGENMFVIRNGKTGGEISALPAIERAWVNGVVVYINVKQIDGRYFVDGDFVSTSLGLRFEYTVTPSGNRYARITDGEDKLTLTEMLRYTRPAEYGDGSYDMPKKTDGTELYLIGANEYTQTVADRLSGSGIHACFVFSYDEIVNNPQLVISLASAGFAIAISVDKSPYFFCAADANRLLYELTMKKTHLMFGGEDGHGYKNISVSTYADVFDYVTEVKLNGMAKCVIYIDEATVSLIDYAEIIGVNFAEVN